MNSNELFRKHSLQPTQLIGNLFATTVEEFRKNFRTLFSQSDAQNISGIVYIWAIDSPIKRLKGESNILYIGKTIQSLAQRNLKYVGVESDEFGWKRYKYIFDNFGSIKIYLAKVPNPKKIETEFLNSYFNEHLELPPMNRMSV